MITKPEQAIPIDITDAMLNTEFEIENGRRKPTWLTAAESAQIARAYANATIGQRASWDAKFREWGFIP